MNTITPVRFGLVFIVSAFLAAAPRTAVAETPEEICARFHSEWHQYFARRQCVRDRRKAEATRKCLSKDLERMESLVKEVRNAIDEKMPLADARTVLQTVLKRELPVTRAKDDAEDRVIDTQITTDCASAFQFVVQIRAAPSGTLRYFKIWSKFPPEGYPEGYRPALSRDFEGDQRKRQMEQRRRAARAANERARKRLRAEAAKRRALEAARERRKAEIAKLRQAEEARKRRELRALRQRQAMAGPPPEKDHCAPKLAKQERIRRLSRFGTVRRIGDNDWSAGTHGIGFAAKGGALTYCK